MRNVFARGNVLSGFLGRGTAGSRRRGVVAAGVAVVLTVSLLGEVQARPAQAAPASAKSSCPASRPDDQSAVITARMCGGKVRIDGDESPTTEVYALPNGSLQATTAIAPQRVHQSDGSWAPVDLTMTQQPNGSVAPKMSAFPVTASGAVSGTGEHQVAALGSGAGQVALDWTGA